MNLQIDIEAGVVQIGAEKLRDQWLDLYASLALTRTGPSTEDVFVTAEHIARVGSWRHKAPASVGKEISRHMAWLEQRHLGKLVVHRGKTKAWRLNIATMDVGFQPSRAAVQTWIDVRSTKGLLEKEWIDDLQLLIEATAAVQAGSSEVVLATLTPTIGSIHDPLFEAWSALLRGRAAFQYGDDDILFELHDRWFGRTDAPGRTVGARLRALASFRMRFEEPGTTLASLAKLAADLEFRGDTGALGSVLNVMGLLARRAGDPYGGFVHHLRAVGLFGIVGDYPSLQGALFNLAICRRAYLAKEGHPPDAVVLQLVDMCRTICNRFGVGGDSAQAEIAGATWAFEMGDLSRARSYLADAWSLVKRIDSSYDQACFMLIRAKIEHRHPTGATDPIQDLRTAERLFLDAGDTSSAAKARHLLRAYTAPPSAGRS